MTSDRNRLSLPLAAPLALAYGLGVRVRARLYQWQVLRTARLGQRVISVGNITAGGTGKTPIVEYLARHLVEKECQVSILSRGYGRNTRGVFFVCQGHGPLAEPQCCGDEPYLLARSLPRTWVTVSERRFEAGAAVERQLPRCVHLLDDGYQHLHLRRELNILLLDATDPFGGGRLLPWGRLREPLSAITRADLIVITRADHPFEERRLTRRIKRFNLRAPIVYAYHDVQGLVDLRTGHLHPMREFFRRRVLAFAGIARPEIFSTDLARHQVDVARLVSFPDHYRYVQTDIDTIFSTAQSLGAQAVVTTEKDEINMWGLHFGNLPIYSLRIEARFSEESQVQFYLQEFLD